MGVGVMGKIPKSSCQLLKKVFGQMHAKHALCTNVANNWAYFGLKWAKQVRNHENRGSLRDIFEKTGVLGVSLL